MNPAVKAAWVEALRSGEYQQTNGKLRDDKGFCCLGVLCDLAVKEGIGTWDTEPRISYEITFISSSDPSHWSGTMLTDEVVRWAGLVDQDPIVPVPAGNGNRMVTLSWLNDDTGATFAEIADAIEKEF